MRVEDLAKRSFEALTKLDYPNLELIIVDNGSTDGSREVVKEYANHVSNNLTVKLVVLEENVGWTGAINAGYAVKDQDATYVALTHNDLIPKPNYLKELVSFLENHEDVGAVQGLVFKLGSSSVIDSAGFVMNESLKLVPINKTNLAPLTKPTFLSYVEGTMPVYNVNAVRHSLKNSRNLFITKAYMYYLEDVFVSIMLWNTGYKCMFLPVATGEHFRRATTGGASETQSNFYFFFRNHIALLYMTNSADKVRFIVQHLRWTLLSKGTLTERKNVVKGMTDGIRIGRQLKRKYGTINLYRTPMIKMSIKNRLHL